MREQNIKAIQRCICVCSLSVRSPDFTHSSVYGWAHIYWLQRRLIYIYTCICMCHSLLIQFLWTLAMVFQIMHIICLCMMYLTISEVLNMHVSFHPHVSVSAHMGSFMSQQPRHSLKVTNHFLKWGTSS